MVKLVVHIGHGKTGSSSIQQSLLEAKDELLLQGVKYLGLMLEHAGNADRRAWQMKGGSSLFFDQTPVSEAVEQLASILEHELVRLEEHGISTAILSNEWLFSRPDRVIEALKIVQAAGYEVKIQCYVRRHDQWAQSAYSQWGLKHKSYLGPIRDFANWLPVWGERDIRFWPALSIWHAEFGEDLQVFNFDAAGDVVQHFLQLNGLENIPTFNDNISGDPLFTVAQSVFNSRKTAQVLPMAFDTIVRLAEKGDENRVLLPTLEQLMPTAEMLERIVEDRADDIDPINSLLESSGEPLLSFETPAKPAIHPTPWEMDQFILKLLFTIAEEAGEMRNQIAELQLEVAELKKDGAS